MREIVLDTETTGLRPSDGHRVIEIAAIELVDFLPTGKVYQQYINPMRDVPEASFKVHGLSYDFFIKCSHFHFSSINISIRSLYFCLILIYSGKCLPACLINQMGVSVFLPFSVSIRILI